MPAKRKPMRKIKDVLRLKFEAGLSHERIAIAVGVSKGAVNKYLKRAAQAGIVWPLDALLDESALAGCCLPRPRHLRPATRCPTSPTSTRSSRAKA